MEHANADGAAEAPGRRVMRQRGGTRVMRLLCAPIAAAQRSAPAALSRCRSRRCDAVLGSRADRAVDLAPRLNHVGRRFKFATADCSEAVITYYDDATGKHRFALNFNTDAQVQNWFNLQARAAHNCGVAVQH